MTMTTTAAASTMVAVAVATTTCSMVSVCVTVPKDYFAAVTTKLPERWQCCIDIHGKYAGCANMQLCNYHSSSYGDSSPLRFQYNYQYNKFKHNNLFPKSGQLHVSANI
jgi:hypothetical protein